MHKLEKDDLQLLKELNDLSAEADWTVEELESTLRERGLDPDQLVSEVESRILTFLDSENGDDAGAQKSASSEFVPKTVLEFLRESTGKKTSEIAEEIGANSIFVSNVSRYGKVIDIGTKQEIANVVEQKLQIPAAQIMQRFEQAGQKKMAAFRKTSYEESKAITYEEIVNSSGMNEEAKRFWLSLAKKGFE
ncbi:MAG: hypothetical protein JST84_11450 [Acidobacteria bacterium]|nr:hypothetical protein [Acidobacteriota bacterium]